MTVGCGSCDFPGKKRPLAKHGHRPTEMDGVGPGGKATPTPDLNWIRIFDRKVYKISFTSFVGEMREKVRRLFLSYQHPKRDFAKSGASGTPSQQFRRCKTSNLLAKFWSSDAVQ
jgi:hypothetical protein